MRGGSTRAGRWAVAFIVALAACAVAPSARAAEIKVLIVVDSKADVARTGIGVAVKEGAPKPDISTPDAFKQAILAAKSIVYLDPASGATSGIYFASVLQRLGIADAVKDKTVLWPGGFAAEAVAKGQADLCVHQISEILPVKGVTLVGP